MRFIILIIFYLIPFALIAQKYNHKIKLTNNDYVELENGIPLSNDNLSSPNYFVLDVPIKILDDETDSIFFYNSEVVNLCLGKKGSKKFDYFVPLNCAFNKLANDDTISYKIEGDVGNRIVTVQWKNMLAVKPAKPNLRINIQLILNEKDRTVSYKYGEHEATAYFWATCFYNQDRVLSLYFLDDISSLDDKEAYLYFIHFLDNLQTIPTIGIINFKNGIYGVIEMTFAGVLNKGDTYTISIKPTSTIEKEMSITHFPTYASDYLQFKNLESGGKDLKVEIVNLVGQRIIRSLENERIEIDDLQNGMYFMMLSEKGIKLYSGIFFKE